MKVVFIKNEIFISLPVLAPVRQLHPDSELVRGGPPRRPPHPARTSNRDGDGRMEVRPLLLHREQHGQLGNLVPGKEINET